MSILYLSYTGLLEPLGQSQVLNYLEKLASQNDISLITFEKPEDLNDQDECKRLQQRCKALNIKWQPLEYHKTPRAVATFYDMYTGIRVARNICKQHSHTIIHARGYIPAFMGMYLQKRYKAKLIFDIRAFWPDEMVTAGRLKEDSQEYKFLKRMERWCLEAADHVVTLTEASAEYLKKKHANFAIDNKTAVIPTCVNLDHFNTKSNGKEISDNSSLTLGCVGTISGWFRLDWVMQFYKQLSLQFDKTDLHILTRDNPKIVKAEAQNNGVNLANVKIGGVSFTKVPEKMGEMDAGIFFYQPATSEIARSPTKMGEFLACGVPCVTNPGVGDVAHIINKYEVGVLVENDSETAMQQGVQELQELLKDPQLKQRCRHAAEDWFSLEKGVEKYREIYDRLV